MNKILVIILAFLIASPSLIAEDVVLVAAKLKIDAYSTKDMTYLGQFIDLSKIMKPTCMTESQDGKLIVAGVGLATTTTDNIVIKIDKDGSFDSIDYLYQQEKNGPISLPEAIIELDDGTIVLLASKGKVFKFSSNGGEPEDFLKPGEEQSSRRITYIFKHENTVVLASSSPEHLLIQYDKSGEFIENLTTGNEDIKTPIHVSKAKGGYIMVALALIEVNGQKKQVSTLLKLDETLVFTKKLISDNDIEKKSLLKPTLALEDGETGKFLILDEGRNRTGTASYDDNLELFSKDGQYEKSLGTYKDTSVSNIIIYKNSTKKW